MTVTRYLRAFFKALSMTVRGEKIVPVEPPLPYPMLAAWIRQAKVLTDAAVSTCDTAGLNKTAREAIVLHLDKRDISLETILTGVRYHVDNEYVHLLRSGYEHGLKGVYASNLNDRYRMRKAASHEGVAGYPTVMSALSTLADHLDNIPASNDL